VTNEQLYLAIGLPTIVGMLFNGAFFLALNGRSTAVENRITALEGRVAAFEAAMITRFDELMRTLFALESRITALETRLSR
jgi:hypothetical protein